MTDEWLDGVDRLQGATLFAYTDGSVNVVPWSLDESVRLPAMRFADLFAEDFSTDHLTWGTHR